MNRSRNLITNPPVYPDVSYQLLHLAGHPGQSGRPGPGQATQVYPGGSVGGGGGRAGAGCRGTGWGGAGWSLYGVRKDDLGFVT